VTENKLVILINSLPFSTLNNYEALRSCMTFFDHEVTVIWRNNGVYNALIKVDNTLTKPFIRNFDVMDINLYVDNKDLEERGLDDEELIPEVKRLKRNDVLKKITNSDIILSF
jgi:sulfur relay (sulfurtransferase) DsrF/TusC family protein